MTDLGLLRYFLGIEVKKTENDIFISQETYATVILKRLNMQDSKLVPTPTVMGLKLRKNDYNSKVECNNKEHCNNNVNPTLYKSMVGNLMYLIATRSNITYAVSLVSRFMETTKERHWKVAKIIISYVKWDKGIGYYVHYK